MPALCVNLDVPPLLLLRRSVVECEQVGLEDEEMLTEGWKEIHLLAKMALEKTGKCLRGYKGFGKIQAFCEAIKYSFQSAQVEFFQYFSTAGQNTGPKTYAPIRG